MSEVWVLTVCGLGLLVVALSWNKRWRRSGSLLALALVGQACALQLIFSPQNGMYQFFRPPAELGTTWRLICLIAVLAQGFYVAWAGRGVWPRCWEVTRSVTGLGQRTLFVLFFLFAGILVSTDGLQYGFGVFLVIWVAVVSTLNLVLVVKAVPSVDLLKIQQGVGAWFDSADQRPLFRWLPWIAAAWTVVASGILAKFVLEGVPHIQDSVAYLFHAKYFSAGHLFLPAPVDDASFRLDHIMNDGEKWYGYGFPGWPAVLALGVLAGAPWLVNPLLAGVTVLLTHALLKRIYDVKMAHAVVLLLALSPWFLAMSANFMNHTLCLTLALAALLTTEKAREGRALAWGAATGILLGLFFLTRPLESIFISAVVGFRILGLGGERPPFKMVTTVILGAILAGSLIFPYNKAITGDPLEPPHLKYTESSRYDGIDRLGFGPNIGHTQWKHQDPLPGHGLPDVLLNANKNTHVINFELFGWSFGSLVFVALAFLWKAWSRTDLLFWSMIFVVAGGYCFYWHPGGPDFGSRYWYPLIVPFVVLTVRGLQVLADKLRDFDTTQLIAPRVLVFVALATAISFVNMMPWRSMEKYHRYMRMSDDVAELAKAEGFDDGALVFVRVSQNGHYAAEKDYAPAFLLNPPTLDDPDTIYVRYADPERKAKIIAHFPGRPIWHIAPSREQEGQYEVVKRPNS